MGELHHPIGVMPECVESRGALYVQGVEFSQSMIARDLP